MNSKRIREAESEVINLLECLNSSMKEAENEIKKYTSLYNELKKMNILVKSLELTSKQTAEPTSKKTAEPTSKQTAEPIIEKAVATTSKKPIEREM